MAKNPFMYHGTRECHNFLAQAEAAKRMTPLMLGMEFHREIDDYLANSVKEWCMPCACCGQRTAEVFNREYCCEKCRKWAKCALAARNLTNATRAYVKHIMKVAWYVSYYEGGPNGAQAASLQMPL